MASCSPSSRRRERRWNPTAPSRSPSRTPTANGWAARAAWTGGSEMAPIRIAPSILSADFGRLAEELAELEEAGADLVHVDVMDGRFVPNITMGPPVVSKLRKVSKLPFDVHLMIEEPDRHLASFRDAGADWISVHAEAVVHLHRTLTAITDLGAQAGVAVNP